MAKAKRSERRESSQFTSRRLSFSKPSDNVSLRGPAKQRPHPYPWPSDPVDDGRIFHPDPKRSPRTFSGKPARMVSPSLPKARIAPFGAPLEVFKSVPQALVFNKPQSVPLCVKRKTRREVILATGQGGPQRKGKRTQLSNIKC
ncbi:MAG: hypothetical protein [Microvirus sp.]|nr:MAG: hypothetical protein [Microvirus sp.]